MRKAYVDAGTNAQVAQLGTPYNHFVRYCHALDAQGVANDVSDYLFLIKLTS